jgi:glutaredoxin 3
MDTTNTTMGADKVTIFSTPTCTYCKAAKEFFKENNVAYEEVDLQAHPERIGEMIEKSGQRGVPVILAKNQVLVGFDQSELEQILGIPAKA